MTKIYKNAGTPILRRRPTIHDSPSKIETMTEFRKALIILFLFGTAYFIPSININEKDSVKELIQVGTHKYAMHCL